ncbi:MAG: YceI family protein [Phycisphaeraceae bacterium]
MTTRIAPLLTTLLAIIAIATASPSWAAPAIHYEPVSGAHQLTVDGSSNIHDWSAKTQRIAGRLQLPGQWQTTDDGTTRLEPLLAPTGDAQPSLEVQIPVRSLESGKGGLDKNMYKAMDAKQHPHVRFVLKDAAPKPGASDTVWQATGDLTIAGKTRSVELELRVESMSDDRLRIEVEKPLKMTDFDIDPPTAMLGMARAKDDVTVTATWTLQRRTPQPIIPEVDAPQAHRKQMTDILIAYGRAQQALADENHASAQTHFATLIEQVDALAAMDASELPEQWPATAERLQAAARATGEAASLDAARTAFAALSDALEAAISRIGFDHSSAITGYRHANQRNTENALWIHIPLNNDEGQRFPVRSPYANQNAGQPQPTALYMPGPVSRDNDTDD